MTQTPTSLNDSISELLSSLNDQDDREILIPVIESLLQESSFNEKTCESSFRQLIIDIASIMLKFEQLPHDHHNQFQWLKKLASSGHDITALQALVRTMDAKKETDIEAISTTSTLKTDEEYPQFNFQKMTGIKSKTEIHLPPSPSNTVLTEENNFNDEAIKNLKNTLQTKLDSTKSQCKEFEGLMQILLSDLNEAQNSNELETVRSMLNDAIQQLLKEHHTISSNIIDVASELNHFENHCEQLNHELGLVKRLSLTDELTRLPNRRAFLKRLQNESGRVQRYGYPLSVAILDLDLFKEINDTYGHAIGDEVLQTYTHKILSTFRNYDLVARYGGEEFAVLLPHTDLHGAERALNKVLQKTISESLLTQDAQTSIKLPSFSAGVAVYKEGEPIDAVINRADKAMYSAKKLGRNRVMVETNSTI